ncbi:MAG: DNA polymerase III subunit epsilon [Burkholderiales bacterium]
MRQIIIDTETTGLESALGHRIVELAAVEIVNRRVTGRRFHRYLNPEREIDAGALSVHGINAEFLQGQPRFQDVAAEFLEFVEDAELIIHNAPFDVGFIEHELKLAELGPFSRHCGAIIDTLTLARELHPGKKNSLDALCERYQVDRSARTLHGALTDAMLLCDIYVAMTRGQESLAIDFPVVSTAAGEATMAPLNLVVLKASTDELGAHARQLEEIARNGICLWKTLEAS